MKNKTLSIQLVIIISLIIANLISSCNTDDNPNFQNCCGTLPLEATLDTGKFYIANIFTPNNDGFNDILQVQTDEGILIINSLSIKDERGYLIFEKENFESNNNGWDGKDLNGNLVTGLFNFEVTLTSINNQVASFSGKVCSYICDDPNFPIDFLSNCAFPAQHDGIGTWDQTLPNFELDCFN